MPSAPRSEWWRDKLENSKVVKTMKNLVENNRIFFHGAAKKFSWIEKIERIFIKVVMVIRINKVVLGQGHIWQTDQKTAFMS